MRPDRGCDVQKRKELTKGDFRTKHTNWGHLLLGIGVLIGVEGPVSDEAACVPATSIHDLACDARLIG